MINAMQRKERGVTASNGKSYSKEGCQGRRLWANIWLTGACYVQGRVSRRGTSCSKGWGVGERGGKVGVAGLSTRATGEATQEVRGIPWRSPWDAGRGRKDLQV